MESSPNNRKRADIHTHIWTTDYLDILEKFGKQGTEDYRNIGAGLTDKDLESRFALMEKAGVDIQILSAAPLPPHFENKQQAVQAARFINDQYTAIAGRWPDKFAAFASLPLPHIDESLIELDRVMSLPGIKGICFTTSILGKAPVDPVFTPLFEELNRRGAVLFFHPEGSSLYSPLIQDYHLTWMIGAIAEDSVCAVQLITGGFPVRYPNIRIINSHLGGALPMITRRLDMHYWERPDTPDKPSVIAGKMWYDSVAHGHTPALRAAVDTFGADRILLGTDFPYENGDEYGLGISYIADSLSTCESAQILDTNAAQLLQL
ncbi:MAG TPA: amidohydrolase family protein [Chitinophaga sp.]|uniref:amidohydrolase family protein n=1 Tax=Chitinophaga sp. TaxID=1869181 RepID=UPI002C611E24|nr:amidohydrolase family protein [Chitinophaga sp.]HVI49417.1 amidohydrolase family protein [Chitinophaga sp.]